MKVFTRREFFVCDGEGGRSAAYDSESDALAVHGEMVDTDAQESPLYEDIDRETVINRAREFFSVVQRSYFIDYKITPAVIARVNDWLFDKAAEPNRYLLHLLLEELEGNLSATGNAYIELSQHVTLSGHTELLSLNLADFNAFHGFEEEMI